MQARIIMGINLRVKMENSMNAKLSDIKVKIINSLIGFVITPILSTVFLYGLLFMLLITC